MVLSQYLAFNDIAVIVCYGKEHIDYHYLYLTRLNRFTVSHYGSYSCLSTLKPNLTTSAPRLDTDCWLGFVRLGVSPNYVYDTELAH